ncbi:MAG: chromosomal replication initiator protein DnaA [Pseudomonadota bacterium]
MSKKKDIWNQVSTILEVKLPKSEFETWFSQITLKEFSPHLAIIEVPNKFYAHWLKERYLPEIKKSFEKVLSQSPEISFICNHLLDTVKPQNASSKDSPSLSKPSEDGKRQTEKLQYIENLNPSMTFQRFVVGEHNQFAFASALEVASKPASLYNPLYIFSNSSLGKTHLLNAIAHRILNIHPHFKIQYLSSDYFTSDFRYSIRNRNIHEFRERYCHIDFLLFDNVQFLANKKRTQEEFLFIFNTLYDSKKQMVITGDRSPNKLSHLNSQLKSRLDWGLLSEIKDPDQEEKAHFIKMRAKENNINIPDDVVFYLANSSNDFKTILKNLARLETDISLNKKEISISTVTSLMKDRSRIQPGVEEIKNIIADFFNISVSDLISNKKQRRYTYPRQLALYLCRKHINLSFKGIGEAFGHRNHSTVIHSIRKIEKSKSQKKEILDDLSKIERVLK